MTKNEALQKALDALGPTPPDCCGCQTEWQIAIDAIKTALEMPQELTLKEFSANYLGANTESPAVSVNNKVAKLKTSFNVNKQPSF